MASDDDDEEFSGSDADGGFSEDMEALRRACVLAGTNPSIPPSSPSPTATANSRGGATTTTSSSDSDADDGEDDLELVRNIQKRFADLNDGEEPLTLKPLCSIPPVGAEDNFEDDFETLRAIQRRFAAYNDDSQKESMENIWHLSEQVGVTNVASEKETSNNLFVESSNAWEGFPNCVDKSCSTIQNFEVCSSIVAQSQPSNLIEWHKTGADDTAILPVKESGFPKSAQAFMDAIKKNRSCQKLIRSKLMHVEARIEEIRKLKERVKILKDFQLGCRKRTGRALSQKKDARVQLISVPKLRANTKLNEKKLSAMYYGPAENCQVANYREALKHFPVFLSGERWTKEEKENLAKGLKQQFQEMLLQRSLDLVSGADGSLGDCSDLDGIFASIRDHEITPENMRLFIPKVNWDQLASMYIPGRSGAECQARWLNWEDPLINRNPWNTVEDKNLLHVVQQKGLSNWIDIAVSLGTNRTPFQCLARYQRSLNASILKREWTEEEDNQLRAAVEAFGESNWQVVASAMEGRTGPQCSNRWNKTLHPARQKVGRWAPDEDRRLKVSVMLFGPKTWKKIAQFIPGRTQVQCRERWVNSLDPSLNRNGWTEEEDLRLKAAISEHGYCWSKVAACVPRRTDNQCWRRWKVLLPEEVPLLQAARKLQRDALISNFVDRESERPALGPNDFIPVLAITCASEPKNANPSGKQKRRSRRRGETVVAETPGTLEVLAITNGEDLESSGGLNLPEEGNELNQEKGISRRKPQSKDKTSAHDSASKKRTTKLHPKKFGSCETECHSSSLTDPSLSVITNGEGVGEPGEDDENATWHRKASKLRPRRRRSEHMEEDGGSGTPCGEYVGEQGRDDEDATQSEKASKLQEDVPEISVSNPVKTITGKKRSKAKSTSQKSDSTADAMNVSLCSLSNAKWSMAMGKETKKRKRETRVFPTSEDACNVSSASEGDFELQNGNAEVEEGIQCCSSPLRCLTPDILEFEGSKPLDFRGHSKFKSSKARQFLNKILEDEEEEEENDTTLASFLKRPGGTKKTLPSSVKVDKLHKKGVENAEANLSATVVSCSNKLKSSTNKDEKLSNQIYAAEIGDEMTLSAFCHKLKTRKTEPAEEQPRTYKLKQNA